MFSYGELAIPFVLFLIACGYAINQARTMSKVGDRLSALNVMLINRYGTPRVRNGREVIRIDDDISMAIGDIEMML